MLVRTRDGYHEAFSVRMKVLGHHGVGAGTRHGGGVAGRSRFAVGSGRVARLRDEVAIIQTNITLVFNRNCREGTAGRVL